MKIRNILNYLGLFLKINGILMLLPIFPALYYDENLLPFILGFILSMTAGHLLTRYPRKELNLGNAMLLSVTTLLIVSFFGAIPLYMTMEGNLLDVLVNGYFESVSGYTTTGFSVISDFSEYPKSVLFMRALAQWIGGIGIIALCFSGLMKGDISTINIYRSEMGLDRIRPSLTKTVEEVIKIYVVYTLIGVLLLWISGMDFIDAIDQILCAISTGGFSFTESPSYGNLMSQFIIASFMLIGAVAFPLHYLILNGRLKEFISHIEIKALIIILTIGVSVFAVILYHDGMSISDSIEHSLFNIISALTTTGYSDMDFNEVHEFGPLLLIALMTIGGGIGSTAGGLKLIRAAILAKSVVWVTRKSTLSERAIVPLKIGRRVFKEKEIINIAVFFFTYIIIMILGAVVLAAYNYNTVDALFVSSSAIGTVGLSTLDITTLPTIAKIILIIEMVAGRLEIFPLIALIQYIQKKTNLYQKKVEEYRRQPRQG
jgi:trk system potassium uptake protein TrkH